MPPELEAFYLLWENVVALKYFNLLHLVYEYSTGSRSDLYNQGDC
jgi:hypothetical protein